MRLNKSLLFVLLSLLFVMPAFAEVVEVDSNFDGTIDKRIEWSETGELLSQETLESNGEWYKVVYTLLSDSDGVKVYNQLKEDGKADPTQATMVYVKDKKIFKVQNIHQAYGVGTFYLVDDILVSAEFQDVGNATIKSKRFYVKGKEKLTLNDNDQDGVTDEYILK